MIIAAWLILLIEGLIIYVMPSMFGDNNAILQFLVIATNLVVVFIAINRLNLPPKTKVFIFVGILLRLFLMYWDLNFRGVYTLPNSGQDTETFYYGAVSGLQSGDFGRSGTYGQFLAFWLRLFGIQRGIVQYINILLFATALVFVVYILKDLKINEFTSNLSILLLCFLPNFMITNSIMLRETLIVCLVTIGVWAFVKWIIGLPFYWIIISIVCVALAAVIHSGAIAVLLGEAIVYIIYNRDEKHVQISSRSVIAIAFVVVAFIFMLSTFGDSLFAKFQGVDSASDIVETADRYNAGGSAYDAGFQINNSYVSLVVNTPIRAFYFLASPLPWSWRGLSDIIAFCFSSTVFIYALYSAILEIRQCTNSYRKSLIIIFLILAVSGAMVFAWGVSNAGTAVRHREKFMTIFVLLIAMAHDSKLKRL